MASWQLHIRGESPDDDGDTIHDLEAAITAFISDLTRGDVRSALLTFSSDMPHMSLRPTEDGPRFAEWSDEYGTLARHDH